MIKEVRSILILAISLLYFTSNSLFAQSLTPTEILDSLVQKNAIPSCKNKQFSRIVKFDSNSQNYYTSAIGWYSNEDKTFSDEFGYVTKLSNSDSLELISFEDYLNNHFTSNKSSERSDYQPQITLLKYNTNDLVFAIWAHELNKEELAIYAYQKALDSPYTRTKQRAIDQLNNQLAWNVYFEIITDLENGNILEAYNHCEIYQKYHLDSKKYTQAKAVCNDIERRLLHPQKPNDTLPQSFEHWDTKRKLDYLIGSLDQLNVSSSMWLNNLGFDYRCKELAKIGKPAIDTLIYCLEHDKRLTRATHCQRYLSFDRTVLSVSEASLNVIQNILETSFYFPYSTSSTYTTEPDHIKKDVIQKIKSYWKANKNLKLEDALMNRAKDANLSLSTRKEALKKLVYFPRLNHDGSYVGSYANDVSPPINTLVVKYRSPAISDLIFEIMKIDLDTYDPDSYWDSVKICSHYATLFRVLNDSSVIPKISDLYSSERNLQIKVDWALTNHHLGDSKNVDNLITLVENDKLRFNKSCDRVPCVNCIGPKGFSDLLGALRTYESGRSKNAIDKLSDPNNEFGKNWKEKVYNLDFSDINSEWTEHTQGIQFLSELLVDTTVIGSITMRADSQFVLYQNNKELSYYFNYPAPDLTYVYKIRDNFNTLKNELAANYLFEYVLGLPQYNPILANSDSILNLYQHFFKRFKSFKKITPSQYLKLGRNEYYFSAPKKYVPIIKLSKPATKEDLENGNALFVLDKKKMSIVKNPPETFEIPITTMNGIKINGFVLQAEKDRKGKTYYGIVSDYGTYIIQSWKGTSKIIDVEQ